MAKKVTMLLELFFIIDNKTCIDIHFGGKDVTCSIEEEIV